MIYYPKIENLHTIAFDFDGVFTDNKVWIKENGKELIKCDRGDGLGMSMLKNYIRNNKLNVKIFILSKERNKVVSARASKMNCECHQGIDHKGDFIRNYVNSNNYDQSNLKNEMLYVCNDLNDLPVVALGPYVISPNDAHPIIKAQADAVIDKPGGDGFVRELIERLLRIELLGLDDLAALV